MRSDVEPWQSDAAERVEFAAAKIKARLHDAIYVWPDEIIEHLAEHDLTPDDFEFVLANPTEKGTSDSSGLPAVWGYTEDGRFIIAIYRELDAVTIQPVTAYEVSERRTKKKKRKK